MAPNRVSPTRHRPHRGPRAPPPGPQRTAATISPPSAAAPLSGARAAMAGGSAATANNPSGQCGGRQAGSPGTRDMAAHRGRSVCGGASPRRPLQGAEVLTATSHGDRSGQWLRKGSRRGPQRDTDAGSAADSAAGRDQRRGRRGLAGPPQEAAARIATRGPKDREAITGPDGAWVEPRRAPSAGTAAATPPGSRSRPACRGSTPAIRPRRKRCTKTSAAKG